MGRPRTVASWRARSVDAGVRRPRSCCSRRCSCALLALAGPACPGGALARAVAVEARLRREGRAAPAAQPARELAAPPSPLERAYGRRARRDDRPSASPSDLLRGRRLRLAARSTTATVGERACADSIRHGSLEHTQTGLAADRLRPRRRLPRRRGRGRGGLRLLGRARRQRLPPVLALLPGEPDPRPTATGAITSTTGRATRCGSARTGAALARASSHHGYNGRSGGLASVAERRRQGAEARLGHDPRPAPRRRRQPRGDDRRPATATAAGSSPATCGLIPLEPIAAAGDAPPLRGLPTVGEGASGAIPRRPGPESRGRNGLAPIRTRLPAPAPR